MLPERLEEQLRIALEAEDSPKAATFRKALEKMNENSGAWFYKKTVFPVLNA